MEKINDDDAVKGKHSRWTVPAALYHQSVYLHPVISQSSASLSPSLLELAPLMKDANLFRRAQLLQGKEEVSREVSFFNSTVSYS